jgi:3-methyladenine DNA glycosylase AlkD
MTAKEIHHRLKKLADKQTATFLQRFFKTEAGQYAEGDVFLGIRVPVVRRLASQCKALSEGETLALLRSPIHEARLFALLIFLHAFSKAAEAAKKRIYDLYLDNTRYVNNWDLVDISAPSIVGAFLMSKSKTSLYTLAKSANLWERRIAIMSTAYFIRHDEFAETFKIAKLLLADDQDLIHKAVGWMLREVGKRDLDSEEEFLRIHYKRMPRTMLRYAIERFPEAKRRSYLVGNVSVMNNRRQSR